MREILFRGKRLDKDKWVEGYYTAFNPDIGNDIAVIESRVNDYVVSLDTVGQYTGLKDKNGKKIFEGDIWNCSGCIGVIEYVKEGCSFEAHYTMNGIKYANAVSDYRAAKVEVIGNIHDNPELLNPALGEGVTK